MDSEPNLSNSRTDILTLNKYGFLDVVELKKSDEVLFKIDKSHDNIVPTDKLSTAISQVNSYLMKLPYAQEHGSSIKGAESASGLLVIGSRNSLIKGVSKQKYIDKKGITNEEFDIMIRKALRNLNYSYSHIQIVLYDDLLDNLDDFIKNMKVEVNHEI